MSCGNGEEGIHEAILNISRKQQGRGVEGGGRVEEAIAACSTKSFPGAPSTKQTAPAPMSPRWVAFGPLQLQLKHGRDSDKLQFSQVGLVHNTTVNTYHLKLLTSCYSKTCMRENALAPLA